MLTIPLSHFVFLEAMILNETAILKVNMFLINANTHSKVAWQCPCGSHIDYYLNEAWIQIRLTNKPL